MEDFVLKKQEVHHQEVQKWGMGITEAMKGHLMTSDQTFTIQLAKNIEMHNPIMTAR